MSTRISSAMLVRDNRASSANGTSISHAPLHVEIDFSKGTVALERFGWNFKIKLLTRDEARRIAANIAKLPELARKPQ